MSPTKGEVWLVNLDPTIGDEIRKARPAIVVSRDGLGVLALRVVVPVTGWQPAFARCDWLVRLDPDSANGLEKTSVADTFQVRSISSRRFIRSLGRVSESDLNRVAVGLRVVFELL
jgi:mRNA interferase MazF